MATATSQYLLIFRESTPERYDALSRQELRDALDRWNGWCDELAGRGVLEGGQPLHPEGRTVSAAAGTRAIDGPFAEAKELIGGYFLLRVADLDEATRIARECPLLGYGMVVEVRPVAPACHLAYALGWETMRGPTEQPA